MTVQSVSRAFPTLPEVQLSGLSHLKHGSTHLRGSTNNYYLLGGELKKKEKKLNMTSNVPMVEAIFAHSKRTQMEISKALATLGFGAWNELEPGKVHAQGHQGVSS